MKRSVTVIAPWFVSGLAAASSADVEFAFDPQPNMPQEVVDGFVRAGELWSDLLADDITVRVSIGFEQLSLGVLGSTGSNRVAVSYTDFVDALTAQPPSTSDASAVQSLQSAPNLRLLINRTKDNPAGPGSPQTFLDDDGSANNSTIRLTRANAKALGLLDAAGCGHGRGDHVSAATSTGTSSRTTVSRRTTSTSCTWRRTRSATCWASRRGVDILDINSPPRRRPVRLRRVHVHQRRRRVPRVDRQRFDGRWRGHRLGRRTTAPKFFAIDAHADGARRVLARPQLRRRAAGEPLARRPSGLGLMDPTAAPGRGVADHRPRRAVLRRDRLRAVDRGQPRRRGPRADLTVTASADVPVTYTFVVANDGPDDVVGGDRQERRSRRRRRPHLELRGGRRRELLRGADRVP